MREHTKVFLIILVLAFVGTIIFDWGMDVTGLKQRPNVMGEVNGERIMADRYYQAVRNQMEQVRQQGSVEISDNQITQIESQVWENMVQEILMQQEISKRGIAATDSEIVALLMNSPPDVLRGNESFQIDGVFDLEKYRSAIQDPRNDWRPIEDYIRSLIPFQKLQEQITASVITTPEEIRWEYIKRNEKVKVKYIFFNPNDISNDEIIIEETGIETYYNDNIDQYNEPEKRQIDYILFPLQATAYDSQAIASDAKDIIKRLGEGEDFASLAETFSEDPGTREKGGDLGFFSKGTMVAEFDSAAFGAKVGEVVGPVKSSFGLHIIKVEDRKTENGEEQVQARHILLKYEPSNKTRNDLQTLAAVFAMDALEFGFTETAQKDSQKVESSPLFTEGGFIPGIGISREINQFVFNGKAGDVQEEPFDTDRGYVVAKITNIQDKRTQPLEDVQSTIRNTLMQEKKSELVGNQCSFIRDKMKLSSDFETIALRDSLEILETNLITRNDYVPNLGNDPNFIGTAFGLELNDISQAVKTARGYYLIQLLEKVAIDEADFEKQKIILSQEILGRKRQQAFFDWYNNLKTKAEIIDSRQRNV